MLQSCQHCGKPIENKTKYSIRKYCENACRKRAYQENRASTALMRQAGNHSAEIVVAADLILRGYTVYYPYGQTKAPFDMVACINGVLYKVEVKTVPQHYKRQTVIKSMIRWETADIGAFVQHNDTVLYTPQLPG